MIFLLHCKAECEQTYDDWISVLLNAKEAALHQELESGTKDVENQVCLCLADMKMVEIYG